MGSGEDVDRVHLEQTDAPDGAPQRGPVRGDRAPTTQALGGQGEPGRLPPGQTASGPDQDSDPSTLRWMTPKL